MVDKTKAIEVSARELALLAPLVSERIRDLKEALGLRGLPDTHRETLRRELGLLEGLREKLEPRG